VGLTSSTPAKVHIGLRSLSAQYDEITFEAAVKKVVLKFDKLPSTIDADLLVEINGADWNLRHVDQGERVVYCRDKDEEKVTRIIVITSNHDKTQDGFESGDYEIEGKPSCCGELANVTTFKAHVTASYSFSGQADNGDIHREYDTSQQFDFSGEIATDEYQPPGQFTPSGFLTGTASEHDKVVSTVNGNDFTSTQDGDGPIQSASIVLTMDLEQCTFTFLASTLLEVSNGQPGTFFAILGTIHAGGPHSLTGFTDKIAGGASFPAHSADYVFANPDKDSYEVGGLGSSWFYEPNGELNGGNAQVSWTFEPDPPIESAKAEEP